MSDVTMGLGKGLETAKRLGIPCYRFTRPAPDFRKLCLSTATTLESLPHLVPKFDYPVSPSASNTSSIATTAKRKARETAEAAIAAYPS